MGFEGVWVTREIGDGGPKCGGIKATMYTTVVNQNSQLI